MDRGCAALADAGDHPTLGTDDPVSLGRMLDTNMTPGLPVLKPSQAVALLVGRGCGKVERRGGIRTATQQDKPATGCVAALLFDHSAHAAAHRKTLAESRRLCPCAP